MAITGKERITDGNYMQTYVSQYVPPPFELMQRANQYAQQEQDMNRQAIEQTQAFMDKAKSHSGVSTNKLNEYLESTYTQPLKEMIDKGDLRGLQSTISNLKGKLQQDYSAGTLAKHNYLYETEADFQKNREKRLADGSIVNPEYASRLHQEGRFMGPDEALEHINTIRDIEEDMTAEEIREMVESKVEDDQSMFLKDSQKYLQSVPGYSSYAEFSGQPGSKLKAGFIATALQEPKYKNTIKRALTLDMQDRLNSRRDGYHSIAEAESMVTDDMVKQAIIQEADKYADFSKSFKADQKDLSDPDYSGSGGLKKPELGYSFYSTSAKSENINPESLMQKSEATQSSIANLKEEMASLEGDASIAGIDRRNELQKQLNSANYQKTNIKETLKAMGDKGGYNWKTAYDNFLFDYGVEKSGKGFADVTNPKVKSEMTNLGKEYAPTFEDFQDAVLEGGYISQTPIGVDYSKPEFQDRGFSQNMLQGYISQFNDAVNKPESRIIAREDEAVKGGSKTFGSKLNSMWNTAINSETPELLFAEDGTQFSKTDDRFKDFFGDDTDWTKDAEVTLLRDYKKGRPQLQITAKNEEGEPMTFNVTPDEDSKLNNDIQEIGFEMIENANKAFRSPDKIRENQQQGYYMAGASTFPSVMTSQINVKPIDKPFDIRLKNSDSVSLRVIPRKKGTSKKYEAMLVYSDGSMEPINDQEVLFDKPEDITAAMGKKYYKSIKSK